MIVYNSLQPLPSNNVFMPKCYIKAIPQLSAFKFVRFPVLASASFIKCVGDKCYQQFACYHSPRFRECAHGFPISVVRNHYTGYVVYEILSERYLPKTICFVYQIIFLYVDDIFHNFFICISSLFLKTF